MRKILTTALCLFLSLVSDNALGQRISGGGGASLPLVGTGATVTTSAPLLDLSQTLNNAAETFTLIKLNVTDTASAAASLLMDLQVGGVSKFAVNKNGDTTSTSLVASGSIQGASFQTSLYYWVATDTGRLALGTSSDVNLYRDAANTLAQRNGTNAQALRVYNTWTDASNYERATFAWSSNILEIGSEAGGTGTLREVRLKGAGGMYFGLTGSGAFLSAGWIQASNVRFGSTGNVHAYGPATGVLTLYNATESDFARLQYGGTSADFPAHKRSGTAIHVRLADDSAFAPFQASSILSPTPTDGIGYATGAGGTVTQITSRGTTVTLNKVTGQITTTADSIAAQEIVSFAVNNTAILATDTIILTKVSGNANTSIWVSSIANGVFGIAVRNNHATNADTTAIVFNFTVIKGVTS